MSQPSPAQAELAAEYGIALDFWDWKGRHIMVSAETIVAVLAAMEVVADSDESAARSLQQVRDARWLRPCPPCTVITQGSQSSIDVHVSAGSTAEIRVVFESGEEYWLTQTENWEPDREVQGRWIGEATFELPTVLPLGYHQVEVYSDGLIGEGTLIVAPESVGLPESFASRPGWGYATQLYSVAGRESWGIGDLTDLADLTAWSGTQGADYVLINPLHATQMTPPLEPSPYLPISRRWLNPLYLRPESVPEAADLSDFDRIQIEIGRSDAFTAAAEADLIDRDSLWQAKREALEVLHRVPRRPGRDLAYRLFVESGGEPLLRFATWCAIADEFGSDWNTWPDDLQQPSSPAVAEFAAVHADEIDFYCWLQWLSEEQLGRAQLDAEAAGMRIGVMTDLAVGVSRHGADSWLMRDIYAQGCTVGAPPDAFNQAGQDWSQPPWRPDRLAELSYQPFREMVSALLRNSGGMRIDHIIGLFRLWWIPESLGPKHGTYVRYDHEALIGILALEAHRAGAVLVGEDLGTVEPWVRDYLRGRGILGTSILWWEMNWDTGQPLPPEQWREYCLASVTTHDLPPTAGYLAGEHVRLREQLGLLEDDFATELARANDEQLVWLNTVRERGLLDAGAEAADVVVALHRFLADTQSRLRCVALTDAVGETATQNQPGTTDEYPNWRVWLHDHRGQRLWLEDVFESESAARMARLFD